MAEFKAHSEIVENFRVFEKFLRDRISHQKWCLQTKSHPTKLFQSREIGEIIVEFSKLNNFLKKYIFQKFFLYLNQHENVYDLHQNRTKIFMHSRVIVKILFLEHPLYLHSIDIITDYSYI